MVCSAHDGESNISPGAPVQNFALVLIEISADIAGSLSVRFGKRTTFPKEVGFILTFGLMICGVPVVQS